MNKTCDCSLALFHKDEEETSDPAPQTPQPSTATLELDDGRFINVSGKLAELLNEQTEKKSISQKFSEDKYLKEVSDYINSTYNQHYAVDQEVQSIEMIISSGHGDGFVMGNIQKLSARYGKKEGYNRKDLLKILHYGILALYIHDKFKR